MQAEAHDQDVSERGAQERLRCAGRPFTAEEEYDGFDVLDFDISYLDQGPFDGTHGIGTQERCPEAAVEALAGDFDAAQLGPSPGPGAEHSDFSDYKDEHDGFDVLDFDISYLDQGFFDGTHGIGTQ